MPISFRFLLFFRFLSSSSPGHVIWKPSPACLLPVRLKALLAIIRSIHKVEARLARSRCCEPEDVLVDLSYFSGRTIVTCLYINKTKNKLHQVAATLRNCTVELLVVRCIDPQPAKCHEVSFACGLNQGGLNEKNGASMASN